MKRRKRRANPWPPKMTREKKRQLQRLLAISVADSVTQETAQALADDVGLASWQVDEYLKQQVERVSKLLVGY